MAHLNFKHLKYFVAVANTGSVTKASKQLHLTPQTISSQIRELESALETHLFRPAGRGIEITEEGSHILGYAEQIFSLGDELIEAAKATTSAIEKPFRIGIADSVPKLIAQRLVKPILSQQDSLKIICREGALADLLSELAINRLDIVAADRPMPSSLNVRGYDHLIGESGVTFFGTNSISEKYSGNFPDALDRAPFLIPSKGVALHSRLRRWFQAENITPIIIGEFDDSAMINIFGQAGSGFFAAPTAIEQEIVEIYNVNIIGRSQSVREQTFLITTERKITDPLVTSIYTTAQKNIFGEHEA